MNEANQEPKKDIWASMRENRLRRERLSRYLVPATNLASLFIVPGMVWFLIAQAPCSQGKQIAHIGWRDFELVHFQPIKTDTNEALLACAMHNSSAIYSASGDAFHSIQAHSTEIFSWGIFFILFCAGLQLYIWFFKSLFSR